jgi:hypothetical protein
MLLPWKRVGRAGILMENEVWHSPSCTTAVNEMHRQVRITPQHYDLHACVTIDSTKAHLDDGDATGEARHALIQLLLLVVLLCLGDEVPDLAHTRLDSLLRASITHYRGALLAHLHLSRCAQHLLAHLEDSEGFLNPNGGTAAGEYGSDENRQQRACRAPAVADTCRDMQRSLQDREQHPHEVECALFPQPGTVPCGHACR